ncbi:MAG: phage tail spike protein [Clostridia bacterium]
MPKTPFNRLLFNRILSGEQPVPVAVTDGGFFVYLFNSDEETVGVRSDVLSFVVEEGQWSLNARFPIDEEEVEIKNGMLLGFLDVDSEFVLYEVKRITPQEPDDIVQVYAEHAAMCDLIDEVVLGKAVTNGSAGYAVTKAIENTRYTLESDTSSGTASTSFYYKSVWECLLKIIEKWNCAIRFRYTFSGMRITHRYIRVLERAGDDRGKRFEMWKDIENVGVTYDDTNVVTAVYGRGKGEVVGEDDEGNPTYGRRTTFASIAWRKAGGDPTDKPINQEYVEDTVATALYGRCGRPRWRVYIVESCTDPETLLQKTWEYLQANCEPQFEASLTVQNLEEVYGFQHEAVRVGDGVLVIADRAGIELSARVEHISRDYISKEQTVVEMGNFRRSSVDFQSKLMEAARKAESTAAIGADTVLKNKSLVDGIIDTMKTLIQSSGTHFYTDDSDGSFVWENDSQTKAVKITGNGILIASSKTGSEWSFTTAIDGDGIVANSITSGALHTTLIRILGSNMFYWDSANIHIFDPNNTDNEIRIGEYDDTHYGIGFSQDGGLTWKTAIDFSGAHVTAEDRYSGVAVDKNSLVYIADKDGKCAAATSVCKVIGYTGSTKVTPTVSSVTGTPTGMSVSVGAASEYEIPITISVPANATLGGSGQQSGELKVNVTSPVAMELKINWCKVNAGVPGANGSDGKEGAPGANGYNQVVVQLFQRSASSPSLPSSALTYTFATGAITGSLGSWSRSIPFGTNPCFTTSAVVASSNASTEIVASAWIAAVKLVENGTDGHDGSPGADGTNNASVYLYKRAAYAPTSPSADTTYTFATGTLTGQLDGWSQAMLGTDGTPCWVILATAIGTTSTVTVTSTDWSSPVKLVEDGENGNGSQTYCQGTAPVPTEVTLFEGDLWIDNSDGGDNKLYRWNGSKWLSVQDLNIPDIIQQLVAATATLSVLSESIESKVDASYLTGQIGAVVETFNSTLTQQANQLTAAFNSSIKTATGAVDEKYSTLIRLSGDGVEIGKSDSNFKTLLANDRLSFVEYENGTSVEVAYVSDKKLYITDAQVTSELAIGEGIHKLWKWRRTSTGLSLRYES